MVQLQETGCPPSKSVGPACSLELIHAYSLIHDDLPCMDDDDMRRGKPTCHKAFGEATALLAGDALHTLAFENLAVSGLEDALIGKTVEVLSRAAGVEGMVGGQVLDLDWAGQSLDKEKLIQLHSLKTGALISASAVVGGLAGGAADEDLRCLKSYGDSLGLAFQVVDDVLDVEGEAQAIGREPGSDARNSHFTFVDLMGVEGAKSFAKECSQKARDAVASWSGKAENLRDLAVYVVERRG